MISNETVVRVDIITKEGKHEYELIDEEKLKEKTEELEADGNATAVKFTQTWGVHLVSEENPLVDFAAIVTNPTEQAALINRSLGRKQRKYLNDAMGQDNFTPVEGVFDLASVAAAVSERKGLSDDEKAARAFSKLAGRTVSKEEVLAIIQAMNAGSVGASA